MAFDDAARDEKIIMKPFSLNHTQIVGNNTNHSFGHHLLTTFLYLLYFLFTATASVYLLVIGWLLTRREISPWLFSTWTEKIINLSSSLPFFNQIESYLLSSLGPSLKLASSWWTIVVGIPLILISFDLFFISLFNLIHSISSPFYNATHCPLCSQPLKIVKKES